VPKLKEISMSINRRGFLACAGAAALNANTETQFQLACMTLPYARFPFQRALEGIKKAGFKYVAWGTTHENSPGRREPVIAGDAPAEEGRRIAARCRDLGLEPVMMFAEVYVDAPESVKVHTRRIEQAAAAGIPFVLTFGAIKGGGRQAWIRNLKELGPIARQHKVTIVIKQHGGETGTGADCARIIRDVADDNIKMCYDAGNVLDYNSNDPIADIRTCWQDIRAFAIKDHRDTPKDEDCGPGFGEIDHYKLLMPVMKTGLTMPLAFENIFAPLVPRPSNPDGLDELARRAREYVETVISGLRSGNAAVLRKGPNLV
jgi:sugar phosphate isomerase/epimerase